MSLRLRLVLFILALVALLAAAITAAQLPALIDALSRGTINVANFAAEQTTAFVKDQITTRFDEYLAPENEDQTKDIWYSIVSTDPAMDRFLVDTLARTESILEINIVRVADGLVLTSSTPGRAGKPVEHKQRFSEWRSLPWNNRAYDLVTTRPDWEVTSPPIGFSDTSPAVLQVQVITSSLLLRGNLMPTLERLASISGAAILIALVFTLLATHSALRPLHRLERTIDRIAQGSFRAGEEHGSGAKEFQALESKLDMLGQRMAGHGALDTPVQTGKSLEVIMERVATQLDVAKRLSAISRLSSGVAHEIKNPLNAILLRLDLLKVRLGDGDEETAQELDILSKEVLRLNRVVTTFLDFSRPVEVHLEDVDLTALAREVAELVRPQANASKIEVEFSATEASAAMRGDPDILKQAVLNLVTNAVEAMASTGGKLRVSVGRQAENWTLEVADSGPGIPPELRAKVFQLYFTSKSKGSGIGLAMTYRAAQLHNGTVSFSSESGVGTTFRMEFPATVSHA
ncbi:MAG: ATP-binding protein [Acidobacteriota bacterium]